MRRQNDERSVPGAFGGPRVRERPSIGALAGPTPTDEELLVAVAGGDGDAFAELYRRYARVVYGLALRRLADRGRAEDAAQDAFAAVWRSARTFQPERGAASAWLYAVARNAIVDRLRRRGEPVVAVPDTPSTASSPEERVEAGWVSWRVHRALARLPENERAVIELAYWSGLSQSEVAEFLNVPLGTVKTRTRSALSRLASLLEEDEVA